MEATAGAVKSRIINIQVDGRDNLSEPDAAKRAASIQTIKKWMDRAAAVGARPASPAPVEGRRKRGT